MTHFHFFRDVFPDLSIVVIKVCKQISGCGNLQISQSHLLGMGDVIYCHTLAFCDNVFANPGIRVVEECLGTFHHLENEPVG